MIDTIAFVIGPLVAYMVVAGAVREIVGKHCKWDQYSADLVAAWWPMILVGAVAWAPVHVGALIGRQIVDAMARRQLPEARAVKDGEP